MTAQPILKREKKLAKLDVMQRMAEVERDHGIGRYRQIWEILKLRFGPKKGATHEYYLNGFYRPDLSPAQKNALYTLHTNKQLNTRLSPLDLGAVPALLADKVLCGAYLQGFGFPVPETYAVYGGDMGYPGIPHLRTPDELEDYLRSATYPMFGKARAGSLGIGGAILLNCEGDTLALGNGQHVSVAAFAAEIAQYLGAGYILQQFVRQRPEAEAITGLAVGILRIVTVLTGKGPEFYYAVWRLPAKGAMSDGALGDGIEGGRTGALYIDPETGRTSAAGAPQTSQDPEIVSDVTGAALLNVEVPDFKALVTLCLDVHRAFPGHGVLGFDVIQGQSGPIICEINANPHHSIVQKALGRPLDEPKRQAILDAALEHVARRRAQMQDKTKKEAARKRSGQLAEVG
ncbi:MAG: sugar-transfer associated ATP-grasp domain-containing protein, partial [Pseudomonadota bacterium]